jgi:hypothetical protein
VDVHAETVEVAVSSVTVQNNAFIFCRYSIAALIWLALIFESMWLLVAACVVLALSALVTVRRAPMIWLWTNTLGRIVPSRDVVLDVAAMRFAHSLGAVLALVSVALVWRGNPIAWWFVAAFGLLKTVSALGFCPASKLYGCVIKEGGCCALTGKR